MSSVANADFKVKLIDAYLKVHKVKVNPIVSLAHKAALRKGLNSFITLPLNMVRIRTLRIFSCYGNCINGDHSKFSYIAPECP